MNRLLRSRHRIFNLPVWMGTLMLAAAPSFGELPEAGLSRAELSAQLRFLASDELKGRLTGTPEHDIAARYIAEHFRAAGVEPAGESGSFLQPIPLDRIQPPESAALKMGDFEGAPGRDFLVLDGPPITISGPAVFLDSQELQEASRPNLAGKIVVIRRPGAGNPRVKTRLAGQSGALAVVELFADRIWSFVVARMKRRLQLRRDAESPAEEGELPYVAMRLPDSDTLQRLESSPQVTVEISSTGVSRDPVSASNVVGLIPGSDNALRDEYVVLMAHYDHVGADAGIPGAGPEDFIFNGARDNGMGVVALLSAARSLAAQPPSRSVILLAVAAEESGLLGSRHYVEHPAVPLQDTVFALNTDGGGFGDTGVVTVLGLDRTSVGPLIRSAVRRFGLEAIPGPAEAQVFFDRSDNLNFARKGVPAPTFSPGFRSLDGAVMEHYHRPSDEAGDDFDYDYLLRYCQAFAAAARAVAAAPTRPRWVAGDVYAEAAARLYGTVR